MSRSARHIPPNEWRTSRIEKVDQAFDLLVAAPDGLTSRELADALGVSAGIAQRVVHDLRLVLGGTDVMTVVTEIEGLSNEPHTYRLVGSYDEARGWFSGRVGDLEARLTTIEYSAKAIAKSADGRTVEGRKAVKMERTLTYLREELAEIGE